MKNPVTVAFLAAAVAVVLAVPAVHSAVQTKTIKVMVVTKEKTLLIDGQEVKGLIDFSYEVQENAAITDKSKNGAPYVSYVGTLITGKITVESSDETLDSAFNGGEPLTFKFVKASKDMKTTEARTFLNCRITDRSVTKDDKENKTIYSFRAAAVLENK